LLALTLPNSQEAWIAEFAKGLGELACKHNVALVGGDTTSGPLTISVQVLGFIEPTRVLRRAGARPGDLIFVSGTPGDAAGGLQFELGRAPNEPLSYDSLRASAEPSQPGAAGARDDRTPRALVVPSHVAAAQDARTSIAPPDAASARHSHEQTLRNRFLYPTPRVALGQRLLNFATACIDVSDGLLGDAGKLAHASNCSVELEYSKLPISVALGDAFGEQRARELALSGGDDYELCFAVPPARVDDMLRTLPPDEWHYTLIGVLKEGAGASVIDNGTVMHFSHSGYDHFAPPR
jgi:thiamine-monophosphate kinase